MKLKLMRPKVISIWELSYEIMGHFTEHVSVVKDKAIKAYYALIAKNREWHWQGFSPKTFLHIFDHTILPILNYAADVWGGNERPDLERIHLTTCKFINQATPSNAIYAELGRYPLEIHHKISMIKYIKRFENLPDERFAKKALKQLMVDDAKGHYNWFSQTTNLVKENNIEIDKDSHFAIKEK